MKALIVEDEQMARARLIRMIETDFPEVEVVGQTDSITGTLDFLRLNGDPDIIFMDVELSDGDCFEIFRQRDVTSKVIMTTAYDSYAVKAFETGSIDYLLKPIGTEALQRAVRRCAEYFRAARLQQTPNPAGEDSETKDSDAGKIMDAVHDAKKWKKRMLVRIGERYLPLMIEDIAFFYSEDKYNYVYMKDGVRYLLDLTMDKICEGLDPESFFRISRGCIVSRETVRKAVRHANGRLKLELSVLTPEELFVSRARVENFLRWFE